MKSYCVPCSMIVTDNDYFQLMEFRVSEAFAPQLITGLRALLNGNIEKLELQDSKRKAVLTGGKTVTYTLTIDRGGIVYFCEENLHQIEEFTLDRLFGQKKPKQSLSIHLHGENDLSMNFGFWIGDK